MICTINCPISISPCKILCTLGGASPINRQDGSMAGLPWIRQWTETRRRMVLVPCADSDTWRIENQHLVQFWRAVCRWALSLISRASWPQNSRIGCAGKFYIILHYVHSYRSRRTTEFGTLNLLQEGKGSWLTAPSPTLFIRGCLSCRSIQHFLKIKLQA